MLDLDLEGLLTEVKALNPAPKTMVVQFPDGLKINLREVVERLEEATHAEVISVLDPCFGACDLADDKAKKYAAELLIHFGHSKLYHAAVKTLYWPLHYRVSEEAIWKIAGKLKALKVKTVSLNAASQYVKDLDRLSKALEREGIHAEQGKTKSALERGQVLGCDLSNPRTVEGAVDAHLFYGDGLFHALGLLFASKKPCYQFNPLLMEWVDLNQYHDKFLRRRYALIGKAQEAKTFGILMSSKVGQFRKKIAVEAKKLIEKHGKKAFLFSLDNVNPNALMGLGIDCWVNTACPRIATDDAGLYKEPMITHEELKVALGEKKFEEYVFDEIRH